MTTCMKRRFVALALVLSLLALPSLPGAAGTLPELPPAAEVVGSIPFPAMACAGCIAGGVLVSLGGWGAVLMAASRPGSAAATAGCAYACYRAIVR